MGGRERPGYVLITGCTTGGIGHSLALEFHERGYRVIATARNLARMQDLVDREDFDTLQLDVSSSESIAAAKEAVQAMTGGYLDVLVNSAGGAYHSKPAIELGDAEDLQVFDLNFHAAVRMVTAFSPLILASAPHSKIVNISSVGGSLPVPFLGMYRAAKSALNAYSDTLRVELAPFGVDVLTVMTGTVSNSKDMGVFPLRLAPNSPYKPLEETFPKVMLEANANQTHGSDYARAVVAETRKRRPRAVQWTGAQALLAWILATFVPRFVTAFILSRMWGLDKLGRSSTQAAHQQNRLKDD